MKKLIFVFFIGMSCLGFSDDRFFSDSEKNDKIINEFYSVLNEILQEINELKEVQKETLDYITKINEISNQFKEIIYDE